MNHRADKMKRCDGCKHWPDKSDEWEAEQAGLRRCAAVRARWDIADEASDALATEIGKRWWDEDADDDKFEAVRRDALRTARAYVQDGSQYTASFWTGPDFFCALHEPKPRTPPTGS